MADDLDVALSVNVNGVDKSINSLKDLKQARKDLSAAFLQGDEEAAKSLGLLNEKLVELKKSTNSAQGSGVEKLTASFGVLKEGLAGFDLGKIKIGFQGLGAAMSAIPILLITEGIVYLIEHFDSLSKGSGFLARALRFVGDILGDIKDGFLAVTDAIGLTNSALDKQGEAIKTYAKNAKEALDAQTTAFDQQIAVAKAAGKATVELEKQKQEAIIQTNYQIAKQIEAYVRAGGDLDDEKKKQLTASLAAIQAAQVANQVSELTDYKTRQDNYKQHLDKLSSLKKEHDKEVNDAFAASLSDEQAQLDADAKETDDKQKQRDADTIAGNKLLNDQYVQGNKDAAAQALADTKSASDEAKRLKQEEVSAVFSIAKSSNDSLQGLSNLYFSSQIKAAHGNHKILTEIAKKQFNVNKALQISTAVINGAQAVLANLAAYPEPFGAIAAIGAGIVAAISIAEIASTQFNADSASSGSGGSAPSLPSPPPPPQVLRPTTIASGQPSTGGGAPPGIKAYVVETDVTKNQANVSKIQRQASF